jgi:hypothetical protein
VSEVTTEVTLHPAPRWRDVVLEQIRIVGLRIRPVLLVVAVVLTIGTILIGGDLLSGGEGFDSSALFPTPLFSCLFPFAIWRNEQPFGPSFIWTFPVDRRRLALAKVFAGFVWLIVALALFTTWLLALGFLARVGPEGTIMRIPYIATIATYLFGSALLLGLRDPLKWVFGAAGLLLLVGGASQVLEDLYGVNTLLGSSSLFLTVRGVHDAWRTVPGLAQWAITTVLSIGAGLAALFAAASRHRERRRR